MDSNGNKVSLTKKTVSLEKKQKISLTKAVETGLNKVNIGLGWDPVKHGASNSAAPAKKGFLSKLFGGGEPTVQPRSTANIDCDAWVAVFDNNNRLVKTVYFGDKNYTEGSTTYIHHQGDNLTGEGDGDDETISIALDRINQSVNKITFVVTIDEALERGFNFSMVANAYVRVVNADTNVEIARFTLSEYYNNVTSMVVGELYKHNGQWKFNPVGDGVAKDLAGLCEMYGVNVAG